MCNLRKIWQVVCLSFLVTQTTGFRFKPDDNHSKKIRRQVNGNDNTVDTSGGCILPEHPLSRKWRLWNHPGTNVSVGMLVESGTILQVRCIPKYKLNGNPLILCENGKWSSDVGECLEICPALYSTATTKVTCSFKYRETENCTDAVDGTTATFRCSPFYEDVRLAPQRAHICRNGSWDQPTPYCRPVCGKKSVSVQPLLANGYNTANPWQVAIYDKKTKRLICGGSLLNQRVILTAAACITTLEGDLNPEENYEVAVGKYYREYSDSRDDEAEFSELEAMFIPDQYKGVTNNYLADIAVLVTRKTFKLSPRVQPVCVDWSFNYYNESTSPVGYVTGWGYALSDAKPSDVLKELEVPFVSDEKCSENLPENSQEFLTFDKLCAGYLNTDTSVCKGDGGGGLVVQYDGRYYITGVLSLSLQSPTEAESCDTQQYGLYTKVSSYNVFILDKELHYKA